MTLEKVLPLVQVIILLPSNRNPSSQDTLSSVPESTGNVVSVFRLFQAGSRPVHRGVSVPVENATMQFLVSTVCCIFFVHSTQSHCPLELMVEVDLIVYVSKI